MSPLDHANMVSNRLKQIPLECAFGFGASICQRSRGFIESRLDRSSISEFDIYWGKVWRSIANLDDWSEDIVSFFESLVPSNGVNDDSQFFAASTMFYSLSLAVDRDAGNDVSYVSEASIALLDNYSYNQLRMPPNCQNDMIVHADPLLLREMERQTRDITICQSSRIPRNAVFEMWKTSSSESSIPDPRPSQPL